MFFRPSNIMEGSSWLCSHPGVPLVQGLDVDEGHFSVGAGHHSVVLAADDQVDVFAELPVTVPKTQTSHQWHQRTLFDESYNRLTVKLSNAPQVLCTGRHDWEATSRVSPVGYRGHLTLVHILLHKRVGVGKLVPLSTLNKTKTFQSPKNKQTRDQWRHNAAEGGAGGLLPCVNTAGWSCGWCTWPPSPGSEESWRSCPRPAAARWPSHSRSANLRVTDATAFSDNATQQGGNTVHTAC